MTCIRWAGSMTLYETILQMMSEEGYLLGHAEAIIDRMENHELLKLISEAMERYKESRKV